MRINKKIILGLGSVALVTIPSIFVVSCSGSGTSVKNELTNLNQQLKEGALNKFFFGEADEGDINKVKEKFELTAKDKEMLKYVNDNNVDLSFDTKILKNEIKSIAGTRFLQELGFDALNKKVEVELSKNGYKLIKNFNGYIMLINSEAQDGDYFVGVSDYTGNVNWDSTTTTAINNPASWNIDYSNADYKSEFIKLVFRSIPSSNPYETHKQMYPYLNKWQKTFEYLGFYSAIDVFYMTATEINNFELYYTEDRKLLSNTKLINYKFFEKFSTAQVKIRDLYINWFKDSNYDKNAHNWTNDYDPNQVKLMSELLKIQDELKKEFPNNFSENGIHDMFADGEEKTIISSKLNLTKTDISAIFIPNAKYTDINVFNSLTKNQKIAAFNFKINNTDIPAEDLTNIKDVIKDITAKVDGSEWTFAFTLNDFVANTGVKKDVKVKLLSKAWFNIPEISAAPTPSVAGTK